MAGELDVQLTAVDKANTKGLAPGDRFERFRSLVLAVVAVGTTTTAAAALVQIEKRSFPVGDGKSKPLTLTLSWSTHQLPKLVQWKMAGAGVHVLGIEPANCYVEGRAAERELGTLESLEPGESRKYELALEVQASI